MPAEVRSEPLEPVLYLPSREYPYRIEKKSIKYGEVEVPLRETRACRDVLTPTYNLSDMIVFEVAPMGDDCAQYQSGRDHRWLEICQRNH